MDTDFAHEIIRRCCRIYFKNVKPGEINLHLTKPSEKFHGKRRVMGIMGRERGKIIIQADAEFLGRADPITLTEKIAYMLAHLKLKTPETYSLRHELAARREMKRFIKAVKDNDRKFMKKFGKG